MLLVLAKALAWHLLLAFPYATAPIQTAYARRRARLNRIAGTLVGMFGLRLVFDAFASARGPG